MKIVGRFCKRVLAPKSAFDRRSFRWVRSGKAWVLTGCPRGKWKGDRCSVGLKAHELLVKSSGRCAVGEKRMTKGLSGARVGKVASFAKIPVGARFRLTIDGRYGWLTLRKKDPDLAPGDYVKVDETTYRSDQGRIRAIPHPRRTV